MIAAIIDANIIIDSLKIDLFKSLLKLELNKSATDLVLNEIRETGIEQVYKAIDDGELNLVQFDDEDLFEIQALKIKYPALSLQDCSCLFTAKAISASLLTGEKRLTSISKQYKIEVHGILWVFDQMISENIISQRMAFKKLSQLMDRNKRLPEAECKKRLELWAKN